MGWLGALIGFALAAFAADAFGPRGAVALFGAVVGWAVVRLGRRLRAVERALEDARAQVRTEATAAAGPAEVAHGSSRAGEAPASAAAGAGPLPLEPSSRPPARSPTPSPLPAPVPAETQGHALQAPTQTPTQASFPPSPMAAPRPQPPLLEPDERSGAVTQSLGRSLVAWFQGGNTIVRAGVLILLLGVAFLLRYATEHTRVPIEWRLAAVALAGAGLVGLGWRVCGRRRGYGLSLQGAGAGALYLTVFAAYRLYALLPPAFAFALLVALAAATALLAVRQQALPLAVLGFGGGFLAPVFASSGQGSHVALFSYYLVLNLAIAWIASRQTWKLLNLLGFVCTFGIASAWGVLAWRAEYFWTTEPFLIAHFLLYLYIGVAYSRAVVARTVDDAPPAYVDGGLLFGVPLAAFGLQAALLHDEPLALAASAAVMAGTYLLLGRWLWQRSGGRIRLLVEALLALGVVFALLVTPLALDARWTGVAWAVQGAGIVWIGLRQGRLWAAVLGIALQVVAAAVHWGEAWRMPDARWVLNGHWFAAMVVAGAAFVSAWLVRARMRRGLAPGAAASPRWNRLDAPRAWQAMQALLLALGTAHAWFGWWQELSAAGLGPDAAWREALLLAALAAAGEAVQARLRWAELRLVARTLWTLGGLVGLEAAWSYAFYADGGWARLAAGGGVDAWALIAVGLALRLRLRQDATRAGDALPWWQRDSGPEIALCAWLVAGHGAAAAHALAAHTVGRHEGWTALAAVVPPAAVVWIVARRLARGQWPADRHARALRRGVLWPGVAAILVWSWGVNLWHPGGMAPLPYLPFVNPVDLGHGLIALAGLAAWRALRRAPASLADSPLPAAAQPGLRGGQALGALLAASGFAWLNAVLVRSLHHWAGTPLWWDGALHHGVVQAGLTILWTCTAFVTMWVATRRAPPDWARPLWLGGAALLAIVVLKLFFVDLSSIGTLERIVSFLGVGLLMLLIGYVSPLPPGAASGPAAGARRSAS